MNYIIAISGAKKLDVKNSNGRVVVLYNTVGKNVNKKAMLSQGDCSAMLQ